MTDPADDDELPLAEVMAGGFRHTARQCTVLIVEEGTEIVLPDPAYPVGIFEIAGTGEADPVLSALISITDVEGRLLVAVPQKVWNRVVKHRILPPTALVRPMLVDAIFEDRIATSREVGKKKLWIGFLAPEFENAVNFETPVEETTLDYLFAEGPFVLPLATELAALAEKHSPMVYESATSGGIPAAAGVAGADEQSVEQRIGQLEKSMADIAENLKLLAPPERPPALRRTTTKAASAASTAPAACGATPKVSFQPGLHASRPEGIDLDVVRSAREAGIPESQINQMMNLAAKGKPRLQDIPVPPRKTTVSVLSESEEEEDEDGVEDSAIPSAGQDKTVAAALAKLTKIAAHLSKNKLRDKSLEAVLDGVGSGSSDTSQIAGSRRHAAALRALRAALQKQPEELHRIIETNLEKDFNLMGQVPGSAAVQVTARAWLEMRSHVQGFQTPVRLLWGIAGALDCMRQQRYAEARARLCLLLAAGDQLSVDRGSWLIASEMMLEDGPPMAAFNNHTLPQDHEAPFTRLVDGRWVDLFVAKLRGFEELAEKKRKLSSKKPPTPPPGVPPPKAQPKGKGKGQKGQQSGGGGDPGAESAHQ